VFGPIHTSSGFAGFAHQYACFLQIQQHRFVLTALLRMPRRIVQIRLLNVDCGLQARRPRGCWRACVGGSARPRRFFLRALRGQAKAAVASQQSLQQVAMRVREREYVAIGRVFAHVVR
ncbi:hypothetical protein, partial [Burkholderia ubonensis]|uniref:hypothetical protein n=1 Tax=Burkholderia ubonensis TaxID=101571 RepID=UPI001E394B81